MNKYPTPHAEVNALLRRLYSDARAILGSQFVGMYLYGSLSYGGWDAASSDVDFLFVTEDVLQPSMLDALRGMHERIAASSLPWADMLEGSYIPRAGLRRYDPANDRFPTIGIDWEFGLGDHGVQWIIERYIVREHGVIIDGPPPQTLIDPVTPDDLRYAARASLTNFWAQQVHGPDWLRPRNYQAFAILTMCRASYTLQHGTVASKVEAAHWARRTLPAPWPSLVERALAWLHDEQPDDMDDMLAFVRWTVENVQPPP